MSALIVSELFVSSLRATLGLCSFFSRLIAVVSVFLTICLAVKANAANVTSVTSTSSNSTYGVGQTINVRVTMSEAVTVSGTPRLTLETGSSDAVISYTGPQGTPVIGLDFTYTVATGHTSNDLDYISTSALALNGGSILDSATNPASLSLPTPGTSNSLGASAAIVVDGIAPTVLNVSSSTANASYRVGQTISIQVNFSEIVTVTGAPTLTLETGSSDAIVNYTSGSGTSSLTFIYTVAAGENSSDLDCQSANALALNGGTIVDAAGNSATRTVAVGAGTLNSLANNKALVVDTTAPTVSNITSSTANGSYRLEQTISIQVNFSENVTVTGTPTLTLETGLSDAVVSYSSGSGTSSLTFIYTVAAGENSSDLDCQSSNALALNGGTIVDAAGNNAARTLLTGSATANSLANNKAIIVDTTAPTILNVSSSTADGSYRASQSVSIQVVFSEVVTVSGTPQLTLETGASDAVVNYVSGSGTATLTFTYTIAAGHTATDLDYTSTTALALNNGTIRDSAVNDATLTLPSPGVTGSLGANKNVVIDTTAPTVSLSTSSASPTSVYPIPVSISFSEAVTGLARSDFTVNNGFVYNLAGSGSNYTVNVMPTTNGTVGITLPANAASDTAGNASVTSSTLSVDFQTVAPRIVSVTTTTSSGSYRAGQTVSIQVNFSSAVNVTGTPQLTLETGSSDAVVNYTSGSGTTALTFTYMIQAGHTSNDLDYRAYAATSALSLNGGTITDSATGSYDAALLLPNPGTSGSLGANAAIVIDTTAPTVASVNSSTANSSSRAGQSISIQVNFSEAVTVSGTPTLTLETGATDAVVNYSSGSGTSSLTFSYTILAGHNSSDLDCVGASALSLNGGAIQDSAGNAATLTVAVGSGTTNSLANNKALVVDTTAPTIANVTASNANGSYKAGVTIGVQVVFSETVIVAGGGAAISIALETGSATAVNYTSGSNSPTLLFNYVIAAGQISGDLAYSSTTALSRGGRTIRDAAGNDAVLTLASPGASGSLNFNKDIVVDTTAPTALGVSTTSADGTYKVGSPNIPITVTFSEAVTVTGSPRLQLGVGGTTYATYSSGSGTSALVFTYTIAAGDNTSDLDYSSASALQLNSGTIRDAATNNATLTLPTPGAAGSLSDARNIAIDTTAPSVTSITATSVDGSYKAGGVIDLVVNFSEAVVVTGTPQITLETGAIDGVASYTGGSGTSALTFRYTVGAGENSSDLEAVSSSALSANGGTVRDAVGNDANLNLSLPTFSATSAITVDTTEPQVNVSTLASAITNLSPINYTVSFSEEVSNFSVQDITVTNGTADNFAQIDGSNYTFQITPTSDGVIEVSIAQGVAQDLALNFNSASNVVTLTYDSIQPIVTISSSAPASTNTAPIPISIDFSESVSGLTLSDFVVANGSASNLQGGPTTYSLDINPTSEGAVTISLPVGAALDAAGNNSAASNELTIIYDVGGPSVTVSSTAPSITKDAPIPFTITFSEGLLGFSSSDISVTGGSVVSFSGNGVTRNITVQPAAQGDVEVSVAAGVAFDLAGNSNSASNSLTRSYDSVAPEAPVITVPAEAEVLNLSQPVLSGSAEANSVVTVSAGSDALCSVTATGAGTWSCQPTSPLADGRHALSAVSVDVAGNNSLASTTRNIVVDVMRLIAPTLADGLGELTSDNTPLVYGLGPANKRISIREGQTTLCVTEVDSGGVWSCELATLSAGAHSLIAWATDPADDTISDDVPFSVLIGVAYRGVVLMTNRARTPLEAVSVSYQTASTLTDSTGVFEIAVPDEPGVSPNLSKFGWSITLQSTTPATDGSYSYVATPIIETKSYSIWDSPTNKSVHSLKVLNKSESDSEFSWSVLGADGAVIGAASDIEVGVLRDQRVDLSTVLSAGSNSYGFIEVETTEGACDGEVESFISGSSDTQLRTAVISPLSNPLQGSSFVMFDTASAVASSGTDIQLAENVLLISNVDDEPRSYTVRYHIRNGQNLGPTRVDLQPRSTRRITIGGLSQRRSVAGLIEIEPDDSTALYVSVLRRYGYRYVRDKDSGKLTKSNNFFVMSDVARQATPGELVGRYEYPNTTSRFNYLELANTGSAPVKIKMIHYGLQLRSQPNRSRRSSDDSFPSSNRKITNRRESEITLASSNTVRVPFSTFIGKSTEGIIRITSSAPNTVIANIVAHQYTSKGIVNASKLVPLEEVFGVQHLGFYDSRVPNTLWLSNVSQSQVVANLECIISGSVVNTAPLTILPYESAVTRLSSCFGSAASGVVRVNYGSDVVMNGVVVADRVIARNANYLSYRQRLR